MAKETLPVKNHGMTLFVSFLVLYAVTTLVLHVAHMWAPESVVLGTMSLSYTWALLLSSGVIALISSFTMPFLTEWEIRNKRALNATELFVVYFVILFFGVWLVTRAADVFGLGVSSWFVVLVLAAALDMTQGVSMMMVEQSRKK